MHLPLPRPFSAHRSPALVLALACAVLASACSKPKPPEPALDQGTQASGAGATTGQGNNAGKDDFGGKTPEQTLDAAIELALKTVYFEFDSYAIMPEAQDNLRTMAKALRADSTLRLVIEGHSDARGSNEYNLSLSQKRAEAIREFLAAEGVTKEALEISAFGEERPAVDAMTEEAYAKNRRGEFRKTKKN